VIRASVVCCDFQKELDSLCRIWSLQIHFSAQWNCLVFPTVILLCYLFMNDFRFLIIGNGWLLRVVLQAYRV
jgi:hypothetical protein